MSECLGNKIMPKNSQLINHIFSSAMSNSGQQINKLIDKKFKVCNINTGTKKHQNTWNRPKLFEKDKNCLKVLNINLDYKYIKNLSNTVAAPV